MASIHSSPLNILFGDVMPFFMQPYESTCPIPVLSILFVELIEGHVKYLNISLSDANADDLENILKLLAENPVLSGKFGLFCPSESQRLAWVNKLWPKIPEYEHLRQKFNTLSPDFLTLPEDVIHAIIETFNFLFKKN